MLFDHRQNIIHERGIVRKRHTVDEYMITTIYSVQDTDQLLCASLRINSMKNGQTYILWYVFRPDTLTWQFNDSFGQEWEVV